MTQKVEYDIIARDRSSNTFDKIGRSAGNSGDKLKKFAKVGATALAGVAIVGAAALYKMTKAAAADQAGQARLAQTLRNTSKATDAQVASVEKWITKQGIAKGVADDELRPAIEKLATATGDISKAQKLATLAMDVSAGSGKSLETVSTALMKAQNGQLSGLSRLGIETKNAAGETLTFEQVTKKMADTFGGQAATKANTLEGKMARLKLIMSETGESIGAKLIPMVTVMADWFLNKGLPALSTFGKYLQAKFGPTLAKLGDWVQTTVLPAFQKFGEDVLPSVKSALKNAEGASKDIQPFLKVMGNIVTNVVLPGLTIAAKTILPLLGTHLRQTARFWGKMGEAAKVMWDSVLQPVLKFIVKGIGLVVGAWAEMFGAMASIPGAPKWVGKTAAALDAAAEKAFKLANGIRDIPEDKKVTVTTTYVRRGVKSDGTPGQIEAYAKGTKFHPGGMAWVGEEGPELVDLPRGAKVLTARESARLTSSPSGMGGIDPRDMAKALREAFRDGIEIRLTGGNPGQHAYLQTGATAR